MRTSFSSGKSETELIKSARRKFPKLDWYDAAITDVIEDTSKRGNEMFKATVIFAFLAGATLALLGGCVQSPPPSSPAMGAYFNPEALAARQYEPRIYVLPDPDAGALPDIASAPEFPTRRKRVNVNRAPADDGPVISENAPVTTPQPVASTPRPAVVQAKPAPADPSCVGWWRVCHLL